MTDPREDAAREWLRRHHRWGLASDLCNMCDRPWSEHPAMLLAAIDAADAAAGIQRYFGEVLGRRVGP